MKNETLEEAAEMHFQWTANDETLTCKDHFVEGVKWREKRSYSEDEVLDLLNYLDIDKQRLYDWFKIINQ